MGLRNNFIKFFILTLMITLPVSLISQMQTNQTFAQSVDINGNLSNISKGSNINFTNTSLTNLTSRLTFNTGSNLTSNLSVIAGSSLLASSLAASAATDFNGDGKDDLAIGIVGEDLGSVSDAGAVEILYGDSPSLDPQVGDQFLTQGSLTGNTGYDGTGDSFGGSLATGDFNGDGRGDLAIGVFADLIGSIRPGAVYVVYGTALGLGGDEDPRVPLQIFIQGNNGLDDVPENTDDFGGRLASGDFNGDGKDDLAITALYEDTGSPSLYNLGSVQVVYGSSSGLSTSSPIPDQFFTADSLGIDGSTYSFGWSLTSGDFNGDRNDDLIIGIPQFNGYGGIAVLPGSSSGLSATSPTNKFFAQDSPDIDEISEQQDLFGLSIGSGDFNGDQKDDLAIGVSGESVGNVRSAGGIEVIYGSTSGLSATSARADQFFTQDSPDINDNAEEGDNLGWSLTTGDFNGDGKADLAVGIPDESSASASYSGAVQVIYGSQSGLSATTPHPDEFFNQDTPSIEDIAEEGDFFGNTLGSADYNGDGKDELTIGVPYEDLGPLVEPGVVQVIYGSSNGLSYKSEAGLVIIDQFFTQDSKSVKDASEHDDYFGFAIR